jgi:hypothetical protein
MFSQICFLYLQVFGGGCKGYGYYNLKTKESYEVLLKRIDKKEDLLRDVFRFSLWYCLVVLVAFCYVLFLWVWFVASGTVFAALLAAIFGSSLAASLACICSKHKELQVVKTFAETKLLGSGPDASTPLPSKMEKRLKRYRTENDGSGCQSNNSCAGYQYDNEAFVFAAAGCGAGDAGEWRVLLDSPNEREL